MTRTTMSPHTLVASVTAIGGELPSSSTSFIGRAEEVEAVIDAVARRSRLVSIVGYGGVGKTRLAVEATRKYAARFADSVWYVDLYSQPTQRDPAEKIVAALRLPGAPGRSAMGDIVSALAELDCLLVLDNCEQDAGPLAGVVRGILDGAPRARVLTTSRMPLGMTSELVFVPSPLSSPPEGAPVDAEVIASYPATALFLERARARAPGLALDEAEAHAVADLCRRLDGLPLSIELAAARAGTMSAQRILANLHSSAMFRILEAGDPSAPDRHQGLHHVIAWSRHLCTEQERLTWDALSVFSSPATLAAVRATCSAAVTDTDLELALDGLAWKAVVSVTRDSGEIRFRMPVTTAEFARAEMAQGEVDALLERHRHHYLAEAQRAETEFWNGQQQVVMSRIRGELSDFVAAWQGSMHRVDTLAQGAQYAVELRFFWTMGGAMATGRRWLDEILAALPSTDGTRAHVLWTAAWVKALSGDRDGAEDHLAECLALCEEQPNSRALAWWATTSGTVALFADDHHLARERFAEALELHGAHADTEGLLMSLFQGALVETFLGEHDTAKAMCDRAQRISELAGDLWGRSYAAWVRSVDSLLLGERADAAAQATEGLQMKLALGDRVGLALLAEVARSLIDDAERSAVARGIVDRMWSDAGTSIDAFGPTIARTIAMAPPAEPRGAPERSDQLGWNMSTAEAVAYLCDAISDRGPALPVGPHGAKLTSREAEVAEFLALGCSNKEIAHALVLSPRTVEGHVENIVRKLGIRTRVQAALALGGAHPGARTEVG